MNNNKSGDGRQTYRRIPKELKQLADARARAAGDLELHLVEHLEYLRVYEKLKLETSLAEQKFQISEKQRIQLSDKLVGAD